VKHYIVATHAAAGADSVLDVGCGTGHDLALLAAVAIAGVGIDPSGALLARARKRLQQARPSPVLIQAHGEQIPLRDGSVGGCRIERVLQHVTEPTVVLAEAVRCLRGGGVITVFEPDWSSLQVTSEQFDANAQWLANVEHPGVGGAVWGLVEDAGCVVMDRVEECSVWSSLADAERVVGVSAALKRRIDEGAFTRDEARSWLAEQQARDREGRFRATLAKVLIVARKP